MTSLATHYSWTWPSPSLQTATFSIEYANSHVHAFGHVINVFSPKGQTTVSLLYLVANSLPWRIHPHVGFLLTRQWACLLYQPLLPQVLKSGCHSSCWLLTFAGPSLIFLIWSLYFTSSASSREIFLSMDSALLSTWRRKKSKVVVAIYLHKGQERKKYGGRKIKRITGWRVENCGSQRGGWDSTETLGDFYKLYPFPRFWYSRISFKCVWAEKYFETH